MNKETRARNILGWTVTISVPEEKEVVQTFNNLVGARLFMVSAPAIATVSLVPTIEIIGGKKEEDR